MREDATVRRATPDDHVPAMRVLEGALLEVDAATIRERIDREAVWVAVVGANGDSADDDTGGRVVGALVLDTPERQGIAPRPEEVRPDRRHVDAIAVTRQRRGQGIGRALVETSLEETACDRLSAEFRAEVEPFYERLGFDVQEVGEGRRWGEVRVGR